ncbi:hypothetical protein Tco_0924562 [Tanacetum coccineum]|uniref:Reverse transcriptase Ty1/copia-type domain-containing protein n=1 Tax=Tanacetum coccineum TaxID=301880 RepID=A0ABQ5D6E8_9ASTR
MQEELLQFKLQQVWTLVDLPNGKRVIGFEDPDFPDRVYKVEKALYGLHQAPRACDVKQQEHLWKLKRHAQRMHKYVLVQDSKSILKSLQSSYSVEKGSVDTKRLISWQCKKQTVVANFTTEAEYKSSLSNYTVDKAYTYYCQYETANVESVPTHSNDPLLSGEDRLKLSELMELCTSLSQRVIALETTKTAQAKEIASLKKRVKKLEGKRKSKPSGMKRLFTIGRSAQVVSSEDEGLGDQEDASKQRKKIADIDVNAEVTLVDETQGRNDEEMFDTSILDGEEVFVEQDVVEKEVSTAEVATDSTTATTIDELTLAQALIEIKEAKPKAVTRPKVKDKGKTKMVEPEKPLKKKDQIMYDQEVALNIQAQLDTELEKEEKLARQREEDANIAEWDVVQAIMDADYELAARLQTEEQGELTIEEKSRLFVELMNKKKKHFARLRVEEQRRKPPSKAQKRNTMSTYLKNMKQKLDENVEAEVDDEAKMKKHMEIVPDDEVEINAIPLATKPPIIIDWKIIKEGKIGYFQIIRADESSKMYSSMIRMLLSIDREDLETLWKLVKAKHGLTRLEEAYERVLWGDLKMMFEPDVESEV